QAVSYKRLREVEAQLRTEVEELFAPPRTKRPARGPRWAGGARGDRAARGSLGAAGGGQSGAGSSCPGTYSNRASRVGGQDGAARGAGAHDGTSPRWAPSAPTDLRASRRRPIQL